MHCQSYAVMTSLRTAKLQQKEALPDEKSLRNESSFLKKEAWARGYTQNDSAAAKRKELTDQASPWYRPRELFLQNHPSALPGGWPASRGLECKTIRRRTSGQIREVPKGSGREMGMRKAYVHCEWKEREAGLPSGAATKL